MLNVAFGIWKTCFEYILQKTQREIHIGTPLSLINLQAVEYFLNSVSKFPEQYYQFWSAGFLDMKSA